MATSDTELEAEVRDFTDIYAPVVDAETFQTVLSDAKRHIKIRRSLNEEEIDWYGEDVQEEALNWATKLFLKVAAKDLDSQTVQVGAIDDETLLAKEDSDVTIWYRKMDNAIAKIKPETSFGVSSSERRTYGGNDAGDVNTTLGNGL